MRFLGEVLVDLQGRDVCFVFEIDNGCCLGARAPWFRFGNSQREFLVGRFVSDDVFRFKRWHKAINNQNDRDCRHRFHSIRLTRHVGLKAQLLPCLGGTNKSQDLWLSGYCRSLKRVPPAWERKVGIFREYSVRVCCRMALDLAQECFAEILELLFANTGNTTKLN
jgi:hypothetical protein